MYGDIVVVSGSGDAMDAHGIVAMVSASAHVVTHGVNARRRRCSSASIIVESALFDTIRATVRCECVFIDDDDDEDDDDEGSPVTRPRRAPYPIVDSVVVVVDSIMNSIAMRVAAPKSDDAASRRYSFDRRTRRRTIHTMTETAEERRARLRAMRADAGRPTPEDRDDGNDADVKEVKFRNYLPRDGDLTRVPATTAPTMVPAKSVDDEGDEEDDGPMALKPNVGDVDPAMLVPKKANWDLKRDVERRLGKLEKRTARAMVDIAREEEAKRLAGGEDE
jgi:coiled-coil domain-containing protein 12